MQNYGHHRSSVRQEDIIHRRRQYSLLKIVRRGNYWIVNIILVKFEKIFLANAQYLDISQTKIYSYFSPKTRGVNLNTKLR